AYSIAKLFNEVVCSRFPRTWPQHVIHPIHKIGDTVDPNNYKTIMIGHTLAKLYATTIDIYLSDWLESAGIRAGQVGFRKEHQIVDHIFSLRAIIEEAKHRNSKIYCCFVDFRKAFDTVPRDLLMKKLRSFELPEILITV
ncbi:reverse transcriptase domain-containing protein, partial [Mesorhizobium sp. M6A.T.Ce.TU.016.01.1.1]|uniref:reverse transcriptase domain-containing protein n=1 Tax=Mesorhizobium sp. M6A.T.Ce.TU.016.01.1.1 TaxID=2496783 RepID=UPI000FD608F5